MSVYASLSLCIYICLGQIADLDSEKWYNFSTFLRGMDYILIDATFVAGKG